MNTIEIEFDGFICRLNDVPPNISGPLERYLTIMVDDSIYIPMSKKTAIPLSSNDIAGTKHALVKLGNKIFFLTGLLGRVLKFFKRYGFKYTFKSRIPPINPTIRELSSVLYPHQENIVQTCLAEKRGVVKSPTGSGKTVCISEMTRLLSGHKIMITVPSIGLLYQMKREIEKFYNLIKQTPPEIGLIGDGNYDYSKPITVCIPDTAAIKIEANDKAFINYLSTINVLLADEVHTCANTTYGVLAGKIHNRRYSIGFSATPWVNTGANPIIEGFFASKIVEVKETDMIDMGIIMKPLFKFYKAPGAYAPKQFLNREYSHYIYNQLYDFLIVKNAARNKLIVKLAIEFIGRREGPILIIVNKVGTTLNTKTGKPSLSHSNLLKELIEAEGYDLPVLHGQIPKGDREEIFDQLREYKIPGVIAGPKVMTEGVDIHSIACVILAGAGKSDKDMIQRVGRALRRKEGKERPLIIDFLDSGIYFQGQSYSRMDTADAIYPDCVEVV